MKNEEIKEIFTILELSKKMDSGCTFRKKQVEQLLDYITNLRQEINKLTAESTEWESKYYDLQQENEELKKNQRYYKNGVFSLEYDKETLSDMVDDYKSRLEKVSNKLDSMFANGEENKILDDLLELDKIIKGDKQ